MKKNKIEKYFGFTLVELIIVITILAILATIAFVSFQNYTSQTRDTKRVSDLTQISKGLDIFQVTSGTLPTPDNPTTYTGGNVTLLKGKINSKVLSNLAGEVFDPSTKTEYTYATIGNGKYYQIGADSENLVTSIFQNTYADAKSSIVKGNYLFDPSLPSLIISSGSSLFDPNNCFVINGGTNLVSNNTNCTPKSSTSLKNFDSSLVGYWDMESYYQTSYSSVANTVFLKDLSGNNYDMFLEKNSSPINTTTTNSGNIFTGSQLGTGVYFDNNNFKLGFNSVEYGKNFTYNSRNVTYPAGNMFYSNSNNSGGTMKSGISSVSIIDYKNDSWVLTTNNRVITFKLYNAGAVDSGDFVKNIDASFFRLKNGKLQEHITPYNDGLSTSTGIYGLNGCGNNNGFASWPYDFCSNSHFSSVQNIYLSGKYILTTNINFTDKKECVYINGKKLDCADIPLSTIQRLQDGGYKYGGFWISYSGEPFSGIIDDVKVYNRLLSDDEILQQAKSAGF